VDGVDDRASLNRDSGPSGQENNTARRRLQSRRATSVNALRAGGRWRGSRLRVTTFGDTRSKAAHFRQHARLRGVQEA